MKKFWNFIKNEDTDETELYFEGPISNETWWGDEITPKIFKDELSKHPGNLTVWLCSPGKQYIYRNAGMAERTVKIGHQQRKIQGCKSEKELF